MRPVKLTMSAFGPFAGVAEVDFTLLGTEGVYLLAGETGAGKTTVFDAITFALFGRCSGDTRKPENLRSDFAGPDVQTYVDLTFELRGKRYRIVRDPGGYERNKKRGTGTTTCTADACIQLPDGTELTGIDQVNKKVTDLLGIDANQFGQIVMLAQGDFEKLLTEGTKERTAIFRKIFGTDIYQRFQDELARRRSELKDKCAQGAHEVELLAKQALGAMDEADEPRARIADWAQRNTLQASNVLEALGDEQTLVSGRHERAAEELAQARAAHDALALEQDRARQAEQTRTEMTQAEGQLARLDAAAPGLQQARDDAEAGYAGVAGLQQRAGALHDQLPSYAKHTQALAEADEATRAKEQADRALVSDQAGVQAAEQAQAALSEQAGRLTGAREALADARVQAQAAQQALRDAEALKTAADNAAACEKQLAESDKRLVKADEYMRKLDEDDAADQQAITERRGQEAALAGAPDALAQARLDAQAAQADLSAVQDLARQLRDLEADLARKQDAHRTAAQAYTRAADAHDEAARTLEQLRRAREDGLAGVLAAGLQPGHACPVCGSLEHPHPAQQTGATPTREDVNAAQAREEEARKRASDLCGQAQAAKQLVDAAQEALADFSATNGTKEELAQRAQGARTACDAAARNVAQLEAQVASLDTVREAITKTQEALTKRATTRQEAQGRLMNIHADRASQSALLASALDAIAATGRAREEVPSIYQAAQAALAQAQADQAACERDAARLTEIESRQASAQAALDEALAQLDAARQAQQQAAQAASVAQERARTLADGLEFESETQARQAIAQVDGQVAALTRAHDEAARALEDNARARTAAAPTLDALKARLASLGDPDAARIAAELAQATQALKQAQDAERSCDQALRTLDGLHDSLAKLAARDAKLQDAYAHADRLSRVAEGSMQGMGKLSFETFVQMRYFEVVLQAANTRLVQMTQGQYELVRSDRLEGNSKMGLEVDVLDNCTGKARSAKSLSGGEKFMASLALALGLSEVVQLQAGGIQLDTMFVDEGFGSLDQEKLRLVMRAMTGQGSSGKLVGIISHVEELMDTIDRKIVVEKGRTGSTLHVEV